MNLDNFADQVENVGVQASTDHTIEILTPEGYILEVRGIVWDESNNSFIILTDECD